MSKSTQKKSIKDFVKDELLKEKQNKVKGGCCEDPPPCTGNNC